MPDDDAGPQRGDRDAGVAEQLLDLPAAAQVGGEGVGVVTEATEVDDAFQPRVGRDPTERPGRLDRKSVV